MYIMCGLVFVSFPLYARNIMSILRPTILTLSFTILSSFILSLKHCFFAIICSVCYLPIRTSVIDHLTFPTFNLHIWMFVYVLYCK